VEGEENMKMKSLEAMVSPGQRPVPCKPNGGFLSFYAKGRGDRLIELKPKILRPRSMRMVAQTLTILVMILLPAGGWGSPLSDELYNEPVSSLNEKIVMVTDFFRAFHIYECLVDVRIEEGGTFDIKLRNPNPHELQRMKDFLGKHFSNLKRHGFSKLSIRIGETRYVWEVK